MQGKDCIMKISMIHVLIEENYMHNVRNQMMLKGLSVVSKRKRVPVKLYTREEDLPEGISVVILVCASLKYAADMIEGLNKKKIHPILFGFQYLDTVYRYSSVTFTYTRTMYRLTKHLLQKTVSGRTAFVGFNEDSVPDALKLKGVRQALQERGQDCAVYENDGNVAKCVENFRKESEGVELIVCSNDMVAVYIHSLCAELEQNRRLCSCGGLRISEFVKDSYPHAKIDYYKAGEQLAELYFLLLKNEDIYATELTLELAIDFGEEGVREEYSGVVYSNQIVDSYGDISIAEIEKLEQMLLHADEMDLNILREIVKGSSYEQIAETYYFSPTAVKYRLHALMDKIGARSRKELVDCLERYRIQF